MADSPELARLTGIETERVIKATWILGASLAAAAGCFLAIDTHVETMMGFKVLLPLFAAAILGGVGSPYGAMLGGLVIGVVEEISTYPWIGDAPLVSPGYKAGVAFALMVIMLIWRPSGLLKAEGSSDGVAIPSTPGTSSPGPTVCAFLLGRQSDHHRSDLGANRRARQRRKVNEVGRHP